jgi:uncharacterized lipoprotein YajG
MVVINPEAPKVQLDKYYNKKLNLRVVDSRENKEFIGFRTPVSTWKFEEEYNNPDYAYNYPEPSLITTLNSNQDLAAIIQKKLSENLNKRGLKVKRFTINQLSVELVELSVIPATYRAKIYNKIIVRSLNKTNNFKKVYEKQIISYEPIFGIASDEYYNQVINDCLDQNIQSIINDNQLWNFLD